MHICGRGSAQGPPATVFQDVATLLRSNLEPPVLAELFQQLEALGVSTLRFPEAGHAFVHDPSRESYRAADAAIAWQTAKDWVFAAE